MNASEARRRVLDMITPADKGNHPYRQDDIYTMSSEIWRDLIASDNDLTSIHRPDYINDYLPIIRHESIIDATINDLHQALAVILADPYSVDWMSHQYLDLSLCPVHHGDYAACFDDDEEDCRVIRQYFPQHDT
ncbi:hypothetical protein SEA_HUWBERT_115 [Microbacterium phage Huwbert]|nr:hypothetical protein SEA_HUWBERT_7 [Microbacterium phage Huwbert]WNO27864.1 hypothetical protein SEA_HUWBERT_115 [Microbacterium phage Huwbert]